jgi:hypothetical protein
MPDPNSHIQAHKAELHALCRTYGVERLELLLFGRPRPRRSTRR